MAAKNELIKAKAIAKAWTDPEFRLRLKDDPKGVLMEMGMEGLEGKEVKIYEDSENRKFVVADPKTADKEPQA